jgi:cytidine deaminase
VPATDLDPADRELVAAARAAVDEHGDGDVHTVAAAVRDEHGRVHVGLDLFHVTGGPCAELVALAVARGAGARRPVTIVAVGDGGRGVLAPCGRDRQVLADHHPGIRVLVPSPDGPRVVPVVELLPHAFRAAAQGVQRLRFNPRYLAAVRDGSKRVTMRFRDPVTVGPALLVFEFPEEVVLPGRVTATVQRTVDGVSDAEARACGFPSRAQVLPGLRSHYPDLTGADEIVLVSFDVDP